MSQQEEWQHIALAGNEVKWESECENTRRHNNEGKNPHRVKVFGAMKHSEELSQPF